MMRRVEVAAEVDGEARSGRVGRTENVSLVEEQAVPVPPWIAEIEGGGEDDLPLGPGSCRPLKVAWTEERPWPRCRRIDCRRCWAGAVRVACSALNHRLRVSGQLGNVPPPLVSVRKTVRALGDMGGVTDFAAETAAKVIDILEWFSHDIRCGRAEGVVGKIHGGWAGNRLAAVGATHELWTYEVLVHEPSRGKPLPAEWGSLKWNEWGVDGELGPAGFFAPPPADAVLSAAIARSLALRKAPRGWFRQIGCLHSTRVAKLEWGVLPWEGRTTLRLPKRPRLAVDRPEKDDGWDEYYVALLHGR